LLCFAASGVISIVITAAGMLAMKAQHPPACATTLIISLGLLTTFRDAIFIILAIAMFAVRKFMSADLWNTVQRSEQS